jgi:hypothetical protein
MLSDTDAREHVPDVPLFIQTRQSIADDIDSRRRRSFHGILVSVACVRLLSDRPTRLNFVIQGTGKSPLPPYSRGYTKLPHKQSFQLNTPAHSNGL